MILPHSIGTFAEYDNTIFLMSLQFQQWMTEPL